jgi:hypothetical protein
MWWYKLKYKNLDILIFLVLSFVFFLILKPEKLRNSSLERVAKDWAYVIRACQVIPIYPLSEDLQPGDVLLVSTPVNEQVEIYNEKGFLPIDQHVVRLYPNEFGDFYKSRYGIVNQSCPAMDWQRMGSNGLTNWNTAPHVAFPPYHFSVSTGSGTNIALPVKGVPVALGIMNSSKASGTLTITDAFTYGMDNFHLSMQVKQWADEQRSFLRNYEPRDSLQQYLRVVSRVYIASKVDITISNEESSSGKLSLLNKKQKSDTDISSKDTIVTENSDANIDIASASSRVVTLSERFPKPLVIGYVGFDMPILKGGRLGVPISTVNQLAGMRQEVKVEASGSALLRLSAITLLFGALEKDAQKNTEAAEILKDLNRLEALLPSHYSFSSYLENMDGKIQKEPGKCRGDPIQHEGFGSVLEYLTDVNYTIDVITRNKQKLTDSTLLKELNSAEIIFAEISKKVLTHPDVINAIDKTMYSNY